MFISNVPKAGSAIFSIPLALLFALLGNQYCIGQQSAASQQSFPDVASVTGPATVSLGDLAEITVPAGFRFVEPTGARQILMSMNNPVPQNLLGMLRPEVGGWFAIVEFADLGYVSDASSTLDANEIMKAVRANFTRQSKAQAGASAPSIGKVNWAVPPAYAAEGNRLEYAVQEGEPGSGSVNYCVAFLGRKGVITVVGVLPNEPGMDLTPFREMTGGISFKQGQRYADHQSDDRMAHATLAELVANEDGISSYARAAMAQIESKGPWAAVAVALLFAGWKLTSVAIRTRKPVRPTNGSPRRVVPHATANGSHQVPRPALATFSARQRNGKSLRHAGRRKKRFSYHAFYSDMVMSLTRCNYVGGFGTFSTEYPEDINGSFTNEGTAQPVHFRSHNHSSTPAIDPQESNALALESAKLIESQQKLIEGQRKLIEEQSKLIQEKSKIIDAENRVMEKQTELFAEQQLL
jgi:uncharacterized membrane-anchored protein